ncbi:MAG: class I SAM-dependent methyltransferase [Pseudonocardiaceae bacterium]
MGASEWRQLPAKHVLEVGCGAGRFTEVLLDAGSYVTSIDLSRAVEANAETAPVSSRHRIAQADMLELPFVPRGFDVVFCLGVVQHAPSPEIAIAALFSHVRPGGQLVFDQYGHTISWYTKTQPLFRRALAPVGARRRMEITETLVNRLFPLHARLERSPLAHAVVSRLSPVATYFHGYPELTLEHQLEWALVDTHDALSDRYKRFTTVRRTRSLLGFLGAVDVRVERRRSLIVGRCWRSSSGAP